MEKGIQERDKAEYEILKGNTIIREFMNEPKIPIRCQYHLSWGWLMPACKQFDKMNLLDKKYETLCDEIDNAVSCYEMKPAWRSLVKAIQWYNSNKQNK